LAKPEEEPGDEEMTFTQGNDWYRIRIDAAGILFDVAAPGGTPWKYHIPWADITRVCYTTTNGPQWGTWMIHTKELPEASAHTQRITALTPCRPRFCTTV